MSLAAPDKEISSELSAEMQSFREQLKCNFRDLDDVFEDCLSGALAVLSEDGIKDYLKGASLICMIGRGFERASSSIYPLLARTGGIRPPERIRSRLALTLAEREEISRGLRAMPILSAYSMASELS